MPGGRGSIGRGLAHIAICIIPDRVIFALRKHKAVQRHLQVFHLYRLAGVCIILLARDLRRGKVIGRADRKTFGCRACILTLTREYRIIDAHISGGLTQRGAIACGEAEGEICAFFQPDGASWRIHPDAALLKLHRLARVEKYIRCNHGFMGVREVFPIIDKKAALFCFAVIDALARQHRVIFAHIGRRTGKGRAACRFVRNRIIFALGKSYGNKLQLYGVSGIWVVHTLQTQSIPIGLLQAREAGCGRIEHGARNAAVIPRGGHGAAVIPRGGRGAAVISRDGRGAAVISRGGRGAAVITHGERSAAVIACGKLPRALRRRGRRQHAHSHAQAQQCRNQTLFHTCSPLLFRLSTSFIFGARKRGAHGICRQIFTIIKYTMRQIVFLLPVLRPKTGMFLPLLRFNLHNIHMSKNENTEKNIVCSSFYSQTFCFFIKSILVQMLFAHANSRLHSSHIMHVTCKGSN